MKINSSFRQARAKILEIHNPHLCCRSTEYIFDFDPVLIQISTVIDRLTHLATDKFKAISLNGQLKISNQHSSHQKLSPSFGLISIKQNTKQKQYPMTVNHQAIVRLNKRKVI